MFELANEVFVLLLVHSSLLLGHNHVCFESLCPNVLAVTAALACDLLLDAYVSLKVCLVLVVLDGLRSSAQLRLIVGNVLFALTL